MSTTLTVIVVIVIVIAVGLLRESFRTNAVNTWARNAGFTPVPAAEHDRERLVGWAKQFYPDNAAHWGIVLRSDAAGRETVIAEHEERRMSKSNKDRWHTLAVTRVPGLRLEAVRIVRAGSPAVQAVLEAATAPGRAVRDSLGIEVTEKPPAHPVGQGKWGVSSVKQDALAFWSSPAQAAAIDAWPHDDAELAVVDDYVLVRVPGLIATGRLDELLAIADAARALFTQAAARKD
jgi:hypothetical protein